jgi:cell wall-associated NlpC family hydrolase
LNDRIRFALLILVVVACVAARAAGALGAVHDTHHRHGHERHAHRRHPHRDAHHRHSHRRHTHHRHISHATAVARAQTKVVRFARHFLGIPYSYGGTSPRSGFDCSGFTRFVYSHFGITLPHYSGAQFSMGSRVSRAGLRPGDLLFFNGLGHVGVYVGGGRFIHAPHTGTRVSISPLNGWYSGSYDGARRLLH